MRYGPMPSIQQEIVKGLLQENTLSRKKFIELNHFNNRLLTEVLTHLANEHTWRDYQSQLDESFDRWIELEKLTICCRIVDFKNII